MVVTDRVETAYEKVIKQECSLKNYSMYVNINSDDFVVICN